MDVSSPYRSITWTVDRFAETLLREMEDHRKAVGERLRQLRKERQISQEDAAHMAGVAVKTWSNWERGRTAPYDSNWKKIGEAFEIDPAEIIGAPPQPLGLSPDRPDPLDRVMEKLEGLSAEIRELRVGLATLAADSLRHTREQQEQDDTDLPEEPPATSG